jgi:hypothetical protein
MVRRTPLTVGALLLSLTFGKAQDCVDTGPGRCSLLDSAQVIFVGKVVGTDRYEVTEAFRGVKAAYLTVVNLFDNPISEVGKQYLVFADSCYGQTGSRGCLATPPCVHPRPLDYAPAVLEQLRAEKSGQRVAAVYGTVRLGTPNGIGDGSYPRPLPGVLVTLRSGGKSFETRTHEDGVYAFASLPAGKYQVSVNPSPGLALADSMGLQEELPPIDMPRHSCYENDLYAYPTGRIGGRVIAPDGKPLESAGVALFRADGYKDGSGAEFAFQGRRTPTAEWQPFLYTHLPAGDYVLAYNSANQENPDGPFPRTFYPNASTIENAQKIHLSDGQQILNADIRLPNPLPTRQIAVRLNWNGRKPEDYYRPNAIAKASRGAEPRLVESGPGAYTMSLLLSARYTIHVEALCKVGTTGTAKTDEVAIDGSAPSPSEVTLTFEKGACTPR